MNRIAIAAAVLCIAAAASARDADGALGLIVTPNDGQPALVTQGGTFRVTAREEAVLELERDGFRVALQTEWTVDAGQPTARCTAPADAPPGLYAIEARQGSALVDRTIRAVEIRESGDGTAYLAYHIASPAVGMDGAALTEALTGLNERPGAFVVISGNLTAAGADTEFAALLGALAVSEKPTVVCPGPNDGPNFDRFFAGGPQGFVYGADGFLLLDARWGGSAVDMLEDAGRSHRLRRRFKPGRWTVAVLGGPLASLGMRAQLDLFADDPIDYLVTGVSDETAPFPWDASIMLPAPQAAAGAPVAVRVASGGVALVAPPPGD